AVASRAHCGRWRRVRQRDELDARSPLACLREQIHELVYLARHLFGHRDAELAQTRDIECVVVRPLARAELCGDPFGIGPGVLLEEQLLDRRLHLTELFTGDVAEHERLVVAIPLLATGGAEHRSR